MEQRAETVWGALLLRFSLGMLFFIAGVGKFIMVYVALFAAALFTTRWDLLAVDTLLFRRK